MNDKCFTKKCRDASTIYYKVGRKQVGFCDKCWESWNRKIDDSKITLEQFREMIRDRKV